ncbi:MAG: hypothetical protein ACYCSQ_00575 [bacterium]
MTKKDKDTVFASIKISKEEFESIKKIQEEAKKKGLRLTLKGLLNKAFTIGLEEAEKELKSAESQKKQDKKRSKK